MTNKIGIYPGTFDPVTSGHVDIAEKALKVVDKLIIGVSNDSEIKKTLFSAEERVEMLKYEFSHISNKVEVKAFSGLLVKFATNNNANIIIRGLRAVSDFEYEFQMSCMNSKLNDKIQTIFLPANEKLQLVSSKLVKEVMRLGGDTGDFISNNVRQKLRLIYSN